MSHYAMEEKRIPVTLADGSAGEWSIILNLTDRWGEINYHEAQSKPLVELTRETGLFSSLLSQMTDEITWIVGKDQHFGLLFEVEYASVESEGEKVGYLPESEWLPKLKALIAVLEREYPQVHLCIPPTSEVYKERMAIWAFMPEGALTRDQREALADRLNHDQ